MRMNDVRKIAKEKCINTYAMKKKDIIRAVQQSENNIVCFATERVAYCKEDKCSWRGDCLSINGSPKAGSR
jgi:hypothetical protein